MFFTVVIRRILREVYRFVTQQTQNRPQEPTADIVEISLELKCRWTELK